MITRASRGRWVTKITEATSKIDLVGNRYSEANQKSDVTWTPETLDKYLANPKKFMPGTKMAFAGLKKDEDRADIIAYLQTLK